MDKSLFVDSASASNSLKRLEMISNNLANASTTGFRSDQAVFKSMAVSDDTNNARVYSALDKTYSNFEQGPIIQTGRDLDVAISGPGFIAIQNKSGQEVYTRAGDFQVKNGFLATRTGDLVLGRSGVISIPNNTTRVSIGPDGSILAQIPGQRDLINLNTIKMVNPPIESLQKGTDGNFVLANGGSAKIDDTIKLNVRAIEGSNVNAVQALTDLIELSRQFEFHTNLMRTYSDNSSKLNQLLSLSN